MSEIEYQKVSGDIYQNPDLPIDIPENIAPIPKPNKTEAIESIKTRYIAE